MIRGKKVGEYNPIFIKYLLGSPFIREQITHRAQGAQHINVSQDTLADVVLLMPLHARTGGCRIGFPPSR